MIIVFSGTDGAGKSTQINFLVEKLKCETGVVILWGRGGYTPLFIYVKKILRKILNNKVPESGYNHLRGEMLNKKSVSSLWLSIAIIDLFLYFGIYARYQSFSGKTVICDRYIEDTCIDFKRNFSSQFNENDILWRMLVKLVPKPDFRFLLYVPVDVSLVRSKMKNEPFPDSPETLSYRLKMYMDESVFPSEQYHKINCQQPVDTIQTKIQEAVFKNSNAN